VRVLSTCGTPPPQAIARSLRDLRIATICAYRGPNCRLPLPVGPDLMPATLDRLGCGADELPGRARKNRRGRSPSPDSPRIPPQPKVLGSFPRRSESCRRPFLMLSPWSGNNGIFPKLPRCHSLVLGSVASNLSVLPVALNVHQPAARRSIRPAKLPSCGSQVRGLMAPGDPSCRHPWVVSMVSPA
jgi:hypothetical protein